VDATQAAPKKTVVTQLSLPLERVDLRAFAANPASAFLDVTIDCVNGCDFQNRRNFPEPEIISVGRLHGIGSRQRKLICKSEFKICSVTERIPDSCYSAFAPCKRQGGWETSRLKIGFRCRNQFSRTWFSTC